MQRTLSAHQAHRAQPPSRAAHLYVYSTLHDVATVGMLAWGLEISIAADFSLRSATPELILLPPPELAAASRACCHLQNSLPLPKLAAVSRACCYLQSLLPLLELATA